MDFEYKPRILIDGEWLEQQMQRLAYLEDENFKDNDLRKMLSLLRMAADWNIELCDENKELRKKLKKISHA